MHFGSILRGNAHFLLAGGPRGGRLKRRPHSKYVFGTFSTYFTRKMRPRLRIWRIFAVFHAENAYFRLAGGHREGVPKGPPAQNPYLVNFPRILRGKTPFEWNLGPPRGHKGKTTLCVGVLSTLRQFPSRFTWKTRVRSAGGSPGGGRGKAPPDL